MGLHGLAHFQCTLLGAGLGHQLTGAVRHLDQRSGQAFGHIGTGADVPERLAAALVQVTDGAGQLVPQAGSEQGALEVGKAMKAHGH